MKRMAIDGGTPYLPQEIIINILKRLPVESLLRFRCVCKDWKNLFNTPSFIADHLHHSTNQNPLLLFKGNGRDDILRLSFLFFFHCEMEATEHKYRSFDGDRPVHGSIIGSSNGLICLEFFLRGSPTPLPLLLLENPVTGEFRQVPRTIDYFKGDCHVGFGFSPFVNDYKIVRTFAAYDDEVLRVDVYSLSTGFWKEIECGTLEGIKLFPDSVTVKGVMFWLGSNLYVEEDDENENDSRLIVSFDIAMEVFTLIPMPTLNPGANAKLTVYENKLAILSDILIVDIKSSLIDLWVMEGTDASGKRWNWFKKYTSSPYLGLLRPMTVWKNEIVCYDVVMPRSIGETEHEVKNIQNIVLFNLTTNKYKIFTSSIHHGYGLINFSSSLVPVPPVGNVVIEVP